MSKTLNKAIMPVVVLRDTALFPHATQQLDIVRPFSVRAIRFALDHPGQEIFIAMQKDPSFDEPAAEEICNFGVIAAISQVQKAPVTGGMRIRVDCLSRATISALTVRDDILVGFASPCAETPLEDLQTCDVLRRMLHEAVVEYNKLKEHKNARVVVDAFANIEEIGVLTDFIAHTLPIGGGNKQTVLECVEEINRCEKLISILRTELELLELQREIDAQVQKNIDQNQKEYYLREQLHVIGEQLGDGETPLQEAEALRLRVEKLEANDEVKKQLFNSCDKLSKLPPGSHEGSVERNYLEACLALPWGIYSKEKLDVAAAEKKLDRDHYGMQDVKERILEFIAVRALAPDIKGQIICLVGPPGVGKTSIAHSVAEAIGRKYCRVSLGGVYDESEIRGHRKTYIGAMPGRIMHAMKLAGTCNPLILLDEIDKLSNDYRGDPTSALLEVLDPEQNSTFHDHYIDLPFDLSNVMFITTANDRSRIPGPLLDRMEIIELPSYTLEEKINIAKRHLIKKQLDRHGLKSRQVKFSDAAVSELISSYTREAGVRNLEREIASLCRKSAKKIALEECEKISITEKSLVDLLGPKKYNREHLQRKSEVGIANGLAWTSVGGTMLEIEVAVLEGSGKIELTGSLGDVMKESAKAAISYIRSRAHQLDIDPQFYKDCDIHIHVPEGATPKDGPSAGITITTALISALSGIPIKGDVAMTGEITLRGRVLPIGGLREKTMAAYSESIKTVIIPKGNEPDISELSPLIRESINFVSAETYDTVLSTALLYLPKNYERPDMAITVNSSQQPFVSASGN